MSYLRFATLVATVLFPAVMGLAADAVAPPPAAPPPFETAPVRTGRFAEDLYVAGRTVRVDAQVAGDVVAAGEDVTLGRAIAGDVLAAGRRVTVGGEVKDDVRVAGGDLILGGRVGGDLVAAGGRLSVPPETRVGGRTRLAGGDLDVGGRHARGLEIYGGEVRLSAVTPGDVEVAAGRLHVLAGSRIGGTLYHATRTPPYIDPAATLGAIAPLPETDWRAGALARLEHWRERSGDALGLAGAASRLVFWPALVVTGLVALLAAPGGTLAAARTLAADPGKSLGLGFVALVVTPALALALFATVLGLWLGLVLLALYPVALLAGLVVALVWLGDLLARAVAGPDPSRLAEALGFVAAAALAALASLVPFVGGWVIFLAFVAGLGAIALALVRASGRVRTVPAHAS